MTVTIDASSLRSPVDDPGPSRRALDWAGTMSGHRTAGGTRTAHAEGQHRLGAPVANREAREEAEDRSLAPGATRARGAGDRAVPEQPDPERTCFERDRDRILHCTAFRRLAGKTQVFVFPDDHQRTRLTHALEVAQVARAIAAAVGANVSLTEAIALGHDCGHGPVGHASEDAFSPFIDGGFDHAVWGADEVLVPLNLCSETLDGIRNHSWSRPLPSTPEGEIVSWADRIAYVCHDMEDAVAAGIVTTDMLPPGIRSLCGVERRGWLRSFVAAMVSTIRTTGTVCLEEEHAAALGEFRAFNYERIYMRPASLRQAVCAIRVLRALVEHFADRPNAPGATTGSRSVEPGSDEALRAAVGWVAGMTDRYAFGQARARLGWRAEALPRGVG